MTPDLSYRDSVLPQKPIEPENMVFTGSQCPPRPGSDELTARLNDLARGSRRWLVMWHIVQVCVLIGILAAPLLGDMGVRITVALLTACSVAFSWVIIR